MNYSNPHTHTVFCDGKDTVEHMADRAYEQGLVSLGFSGHGKQTNNNFGISSEEGYAAAVHSAAKKYAGRMKIWLGVEQDYYGVCGIRYDYKLGGVHYLTGLDGAEYPVDSNLQCFDRMLNQGFQGDYMTMARAYFGRVVEMCERNQPDIVAHFDLIRKFNQGNRFFDETDPAYRACAMAALNRIFDGKRLLEVNTGAMARDWRDDPYPTLELLSRWHELGGRVILGSDCHNAERLTYGFDTAIALMREAGYKTVWRLGTGDTLFEEEDI